MDTKEDKKKEMLYHAYRCLNFNEMLINQCDGWLSAEEGNKNLMKAIRDREKATRMRRIKKIIRRLTGIKKIKNFPSHNVQDVDLKQ